VLPVMDKTRVRKLPQDAAVKLMNPFQPHFWQAYVFLRPGSVLRHIQIARHCT
jgi:hypothetical protein